MGVLAFVFFCLNHFQWSKKKEKELDLSDAIRNKNCVSELAFVGYTSNSGTT